jgi:hypothetical protein
MSLMHFVVSPTSEAGTAVRRSYGVPLRWVMIYEYEVPGEALLNYPDHGHHWNLPLQGKIPMVEPGIEPGTS